MARRRDQQDGAISVMAAMMVVTTLLASSLAVDVGRVAYVSRDQQGVTDRAALDTIFAVDDHQEVTLGGLERLAHEVVDRTFARNLDSTATGLDRNRAGLVLGMEEGGAFVGICGTVPDWVEQDPPMPECASLDLLSDTFTVADVTAVEVFTNSRVPYVFALGAAESERIVNKRARAGFGDPRGGVSAASTAVDLNEGLTTRMLSRLLGADVDLDLVGWNGLVNADVTLRELAAELGVGSVDQVLQAEVTVAELASAILAVLHRDDEGPDAGVEATLLSIASLAGSGTLGRVALEELLVIDPTAEQSALDASLDAASLLMATGQTALVQSALSDGRNFATLDVSTSAGQVLELHLVESPQIAYGRPGKKADGTWWTQARTSQARLDVGLPLDLAAATVAGTGTYTAGEFRSRIDAISSCSQAVNQASRSAGTIRSDVEAAIDAYEEAAGLLGVAVDLITAAIDGLLGTLDTLVSSVSCLLTPTSTRDSIKQDLHDLVDEYEALVVAVAGAVEDGVGTAIPDAPVLSIWLAHGTVALDTITCSDPLRVNTVVEGSEGRVVLTTASRVAENPDDPAAQTVTLLDLDLGRFGAVTATLSGDLELGTFSDEHEFEGPFPSDPVTYAADDLAITSVLSLLTLEVDPARVMGLPSNVVFDRAVATTTNVLQNQVARADQVLDRALDVMGVELGVVEARVLSATCEGPPRLLANP